MPTTISIIIATRNREEILWETVAKACDAIANKNAEIIIINDGDIALTVPALLQTKVSHFTNPKKGVSSARNFGVQQAGGDLLFFIDDDMWINGAAIDWINKCFAEEENAGSVYFINWEYPPELNDKLKQSKVGRYIVGANYNTLWGKMQQQTAQPASGLYKYDKLGSCSLVMTRAVFNKAGGYNEAIIFAGEDDDLANKFNQAGIPIYVVLDITLHHNHQDRLEINSFLKRIYDGAGSEYSALRSGNFKQPGKTKYKGINLLLFDLFCVTEKGWIQLHKLLPNLAFLQPLQNRLIGILGGLQKYKQWKRVIAGETKVFGFYKI